MFAFGMVVRSTVAGLVGPRFTNPPFSEVCLAVDDNRRDARSDLDVDPACHAPSSVTLTERVPGSYSPSVDLRRRM